MKKLVIPLLASAAFVASPAHAGQTWTKGSASTITWVDSPTIGFGLDDFAEIFTPEQGGDPPALAYEPANVDENNYTRSAWLTADGNATGTAENKARFTCEFSGFGMFDSILAKGGVSRHHHTFFGSPPSATADFTTLRSEAGKSTCAGAPLNRTLYWSTSWLSEFPKSGVVSGGVTLVNPGVTRANQTVVIAPRKPNVATFYYQDDLATGPKTVRIFNGFAGIFGVNPDDPKNAAFVGVSGVGGEIPDGQGWDKTKRYDGWRGWQCFSRANGYIAPNPDSDADLNPETGDPRQWLNSDGSDPWLVDGVHKCESTVEDPKILLAVLLAPTCWAGDNLTSPNGRGQWRPQIYKTGAGDQPKCFDHAFHMPELEVKEEYPALTHAERQRSYLSSDRMDPNPLNWLPNGSTMHADLITAWDSVIRNRWHRQCMHMSVNGTTGETQECTGSTIDVATPARLLVDSAPPDAALANNPVVTIRDYGTRPLKEGLGALLSPGKVSAKSDQMKGM